MANRGRVRVTQESPTGRNQEFVDTRTGQTMTRPEFVQQIEIGYFEKYHVRNINGVKTPVSNPDGKEGNNLD